VCVKIGKHLSPCICCIWHSQFTHVHRGDVVNAERISLFYRQALTLIRVSATPPTATPAAVSMYRKPSFFMHVFYKKVNLPDNHLPPDWDSHSEIDNPPLKTKKAHRTKAPRRTKPDPIWTKATEFLPQKTVFNYINNESTR